MELNSTLAECKDMCDNTIGCNAVSYCNPNGMCAHGNCFGTSKANIRQERDWNCYYKIGYTLFKFNIGTNLIYIWK